MAPTSELAGLVDVEAGPWGSFVESRLETGSGE
eukprot:CAMPEP_0181245836 /NCGR_PEP_ID=MMETSP1096-20121128/43663_1 /TAXON_ID=156174 ORGANISM="Chrysochromulina ericina, Strain CCMP281" /NCGR_SAMPLE_ID=MMETSP1096 /ASSEMBLY_ACC=CAM_ASM_000453 /LENGTH=32 /DNA_ID= /DNA_START= /DNA_END= /DNA_ORIENTATION=